METESGEGDRKVREYLYGRWVIWQEKDAGYLNWCLALAKGDIFDSPAYFPTKRAAREFIRLIEEEEG